MKTNEKKYEVNRDGKSEYYRTLKAAKAAAAGRNVWKVTRGVAELVK